MSTLPGPSREDTAYLVELRRRVDHYRVREADWRDIGSWSAEERVLLRHAAFSHFLSLRSLGLVAEGRRLIGVAS